MPYLEVFLYDGDQDINGDRKADLVLTASSVVL